LYYFVAAVYGCQLASNISRLSRATRRCGFFWKGLAISVSVAYVMNMFTAREIATRVAFPAGHPRRKVIDVRGIKQGEGGASGASGHSPASPSSANQAQIDAMWADITGKLNVEAAAEQLVFDRVRHWTREGLLSPAGEKNPGTGRARLYDESAVRKARVLNSLTDCGVTVRDLRVVCSFLDNKADEWLTKPAWSSDHVYLVIQKFRSIQERDMQIRHLARGDNAPALMLGKTVEYAIVVDLTQ
jgi:DNA-binding transcriptional MerR regulator